MQNGYKPKIIGKAKAIKLIVKALRECNTEQLVYWLEMIEPLENRYYKRVDNDYILEDKLFKDKD